MTKSHDVHSLSHTKWNCKYHIVFAPKYRRKVFFGQKRYEIVLASGENRHYGSGDFSQFQPKQNSQSILHLRYT